MKAAIIALLISSSFLGKVFSQNLINPSLNNLPKQQNQGEQSIQTDNRGNNPPSQEQNIQPALYNNININDNNNQLELYFKRDK